MRGNLTFQHNRKQDTRVLVSKHTRVPIKAGWLSGTENKKGTVLLSELTWGSIYREIIWCKLPWAGVDNTFNI